MKAMVIGAAAALALVSCGQQGPSDGDQTNAAAAHEDWETTIKRGEEEWAALATKRNPQVLERILADDYVGVADDGTARNKTQEIQYWNTLPLAASAEPPRTDLRRLGDTVIFRGDQMLTPAPGAAPVRILWTDIWMFRDGEWRVVASQNATVPPQE